VIRHTSSSDQASECMAMIARIMRHDPAGPGTDTASLRPVNPLRLGVKSV
jgi:hypothetical protein